MSSETGSLGLRYKIDAGRSRFTAQAFAEGMFSFMGHNPTFVVRRYGGDIQLTPDNMSVDSMLLILQTSSLVLLDKVNDKDAAEIQNTLSADVLETSRYAEIAFIGDDISMSQIAGAKYAVQIKGTLMMHGEKRAQTINAEAEIIGQTIRANGEFSLKQSDYKIRQVKALGGTLKVKDEVKISFDIMAEI